jgi:hypothetical protein
MSEAAIYHLQGRLSCGDPLGEWLGHLAIMNMLSMDELSPEKHLLALNVYESYLMRSTFEERDHLLSQVRSCKEHQELTGHVLLLEGVERFPSPPFRELEKPYCTWKDEFEKIRQAPSNRHITNWANVLRPPKSDS